MLRDFQRVDKAVSLLTNFESRLWKTEADRTQIELVIMNLLLNAWQAIPDQGNVTIKTENVILPEARTAGVHEKHITNYVKCSIQDNGCGMSDGVCAQVYKPFFTTKNMAKHRGLGLSSVFGIVTNHNGLIDIESEVDQGTKVCIFLPAVIG